MDGTIEIKFPAGTKYLEMADLILDVVHRTGCAVGVDYLGVPLWLPPGAEWSDLEREFRLAVGRGKEAEEMEAMQA